MFSTFRFQYTWPLSSQTSLLLPQMFKPCRNRCFLFLLFHLVSNWKKKKKTSLASAKWGLKYPWFSFLFRCVLFSLDKELDSLRSSVDWDVFMGSYVALHVSSQALMYTLPLHQFMIWYIAPEEWDIRPNKLCQIDSEYFELLNCTMG